MSNTDWQGAFERHPEPMVVADAGGKALHVNAAAASLEVQSALFQATRSAAAHFAALPGATPWTGATELRRRGDAAAGALAATIEVVALTASNPADAEYLCVFHLRPVAAGSASENRFKAAADCAPVMIWISATSACHDWFNQPWLAFTGRTLAQELGQGWLEGVHPEDAERCVGISTHSFEARAAFNMDFRLRRHDGVFRWVLYSGVPQWAADGQFHGFIGSCVDIDERKTLEDRLAHRTAALRRLERQRDAFLAALVHELRDALAPISNAVGLLGEREGKAAPLAELRRILERSAVRLDQLLRDLADVTGAAQKALVVSKRSVTVDEVLKRAMATVSPRLHLRTTDLRIDNAIPRALLDADPTRLAQAIGNLLENALKFSVAGSAVEVTVRPRGAGKLALRVQDAGCGMTAEFLPHAFELFAQQEAPHPSGQPGLGVGLAIALTIVQLHGGEISASSAGPGSGASFEIMLPWDGALATASGAAERGSQPTAGAARRVLVIDDNSDAREMLKLLLELWGQRVALAADGAEGLHLADSFAPEIVLCDIGLPGLDGFELIGRLRALPSMRATLFAALTGYGREGNEARALAAGFDAFVVKPLQQEEFDALQRQLDR